MSGGYSGTPLRTANLTPQTSAEDATTPPMPPPEADLDGGAEMRQRSTSPWQYQLKVPTSGRLSNEGSGVSTPVPRYPGGRVASGTRTALQQSSAARASYDSALLTAVRRNLEAFEEKVTGRLDRIQQQGDKLREAAFARLEEKLSSAEGMQPKTERRLAELTGNIRALSDEMQVQIRRVDLMDDRLWEWRHQLEEEFRQKYVEFEQGMRKVASKIQATGASAEEAQKRQVQRLQRLEAEVEGRSAVHEETRDGLMNVWSRLEAMEQRRIEDAAVVKVADTRPNDNDEMNAALLQILGQRFEDLTGKVDSVFQDGHDLRARLSTQEEQLRTQRTLFETREEHWRQFMQRVDASDWGNKLEQLRQDLRDEARQRSECAERTEVCMTRYEHQEQALEELRVAHFQLVQGSHEDLPAEVSPMEMFDQLNTPQDGGREECQARIAQIEARVAELDAGVQGICVDADVAPRINTLVSQLQELVPKVIQHETAIRELCEAQRGGRGAVADRVVHIEDQMLELSKTLAFVSTAMPGVAAPAAEAGDLEGMQQVVAGLDEARKEIDTLRQDIDALAVDAVSHETTVTQEDLKCATDVLKRELTEFRAEQARLSALSASNEKTAKEVLEDVEGLQKGVTAFIERSTTEQRELRNEQSRLVGLSASNEAAAREVRECVEGLRTGLAAFIERSSSSQQELRDEQSRLVGLSANNEKAAQDVLGEVGTLRQSLAAFVERSASSQQELRDEQSRLAGLSASHEKAAKEVSDEVGALRQSFALAIERTQASGSPGNVENSPGKELPGTAEADVDRHELKALVQKVEQLSLRTRDVLQHIERDNHRQEEVRGLADRIAEMERIDLQGLMDLAKRAVPAERGMAELREAHTQDMEGVKNDLRQITQLIDTVTDARAIQSVRRDVEDVRLLCDATRESSAAFQHEVRGEQARLAALAAQSERTAAEVLSDVRNLAVELSKTIRTPTTSSLAQVDDIQSIKQDLQELQALKQDLQAVDEVKRELGALAEKALSGSGCAKQDQDLKNATDSLKLEIQEMRNEQARWTVAAASSQKTATEVLRSVEELPAYLDKHIAPHREELKAIAQKVNELRADQDHVRAAFNHDKGDGAAHQRLLLRVDELSERLAQVDAAVHTIQTTSPKIQVGLEQRMVGLVDKVEDCIRVFIQHREQQQKAIDDIEKQIEAKFAKFSLMVESQSEQAAPPRQRE